MHPVNHLIYACKSMALPEGIHCRNFGLATCLRCGERQHDALFPHTYPSTTQNVQLFTGQGLRKRLLCHAESVLVHILGQLCVNPVTPHKKYGDRSDHTPGSSSVALQNPSCLRRRFPATNSDTITDCGKRATKSCTIFCSATLVIHPKGAPLSLFAACANHHQGNARDER